MDVLYFRAFYVDYIIYDEFNIDYFNVIRFTIGMN